MIICLMILSLSLTKYLIGIMIFLVNTHLATLFLMNRIKIFFYSVHIISLANIIMIFFLFIQFTYIPCEGQCPMQQLPIVCQCSRIQASTHPVYVSVICVIGWRYRHAFAL